MEDDFNIQVLRIILVLAVLAIWMALTVAAFLLVHFLVSLPMRRSERARLFLDLVNSSLQQGRSPEQTILSIAQSRDLSMGVRFHMVAAWIEENVPMLDALVKVPQFLPPQITAMLNAGRKIGDIRKVIPACRQVLKDSVSQTRSALNYLFVLTFVVTPLGIWLFAVIGTQVMPKFVEVGESIAGVDRHPVMAVAGQGAAGFPEFAASTHAVSAIAAHAGEIVVLQVVLLLVVWAAAFIYIGGPSATRRYPGLHLLHFRMPWRRRRMQRDFSAMLAVLLDSGVPEADAITIAADCTANSVFQRRATRAVDALRRGVPLTRAIEKLDDSGELAWRLRNALHDRSGFMHALTGWHDSLTAKAFQQEQAAAHTITSALVLWNGVFVGLIVLSVFTALTSFVNVALLW